MSFCHILRALLLTVALITLCSTCFADSIGAAKRDSDDNSDVSFQAVSVTAVFTGSIYVENAEGIQGIRVDTTIPFTEGAVVDVSGKIWTDDATGERYVAPADGYPRASEGYVGPRVLDPRGIAVKALVGGDFGLQDGIAGSYGLNNIGMLVRISGAVSSFDPVKPESWFKITDSAGTEVKVIVPSGMKLDMDWDQVAITGICSVEKVSGVMARVLRVRQSGDIANYQSWLQSKLDAMTLDQKIGQMFQLRVNGGYVMNSTDYANVEALHVGGFVYFANNFNGVASQAADLSNALQTAAMNAGGIPLLISMDQEGGRVTRITGGCEFPGNMGIGASRSADLAQLTGSVFGSEIRAVGGNMDLAPVLDVNNNAANPVIGVRSFGEQPDLASSLGIAYMNGLHSSGVIATGKHFPGHGDTAVDSHSNLPTVTYDFNTLDNIHGKPFRDAVAAGLDCIMTAHIIVTCLDEVRPATLSPAVLTVYLRGNIGFDGVCMTDSMGMAGITSGYGPGPAAVLAVQAGNDLLSCLDPSIYGPAIPALKAAVTSGAITEARIDQSVTRILKLKRRYGLFANPYVNASEAGAIVGSADHRASELSAARAAITLVQNTGNILPLSLTSGQKVLLVTVQSDTTPPYNYPETTPDAASRFATCIAQKWSDVQSLAVNANPSSSSASPGFSSRNSVKNAAASAAVIIFGCSRANIYSNQVTLIKDLIATGTPVICVGLREPYELANFTGVDAYLAAYNYRDCGFQAAADVIFGDWSPTGHLPVSIPGTSYAYDWGLGF